MGKKRKTDQGFPATKIKQLSYVDDASDLHKSSSFYQTLLEQSSDPIFAFGFDGTILYANTAFLRNTLLTLAEATSRKLWDLLSEEEATRWQDAVRQSLELSKSTTIKSRSIKTLPDRVFLTTLNPVIDENGQPYAMIGISKEITERKRMEELLHRMGTHDLLTGLFNRNYFDVEMERLQLSRMFPVSIVVADMNMLKGINDRYGHARGDEILQQVADCIRQSFRAEDVIARIGGDEFGVLLPFTDSVIASEIVQRLKDNLERLDNPLVGLSIGIATSNLEEELLAVYKRADNQMYREKMKIRTGR